MKKFNGEKFCADLIKFRGDESQTSFASKLGVNRSTLSLLENGKQIPSIDILSQLCNLGAVEPNDYFEEIYNDSLIYLMGSLEDEDKEKIEDLIERIKIKEKYDYLVRRCKNVDN